MSYNIRVYIFLFVFYMLFNLFIMYFSIIDKDYINIYLKSTTVIFQISVDIHLSVNMHSKCDCNTMYNI